MDYLINISSQIIEGSKITYLLFFLTLLLSMPLGLFIALVRISRFRILQFVTGTYIWLLRGTPLLLQLFFIFFGLPILGISIERFPAAIIAFSLNYAAYFAEIFRSGIQSIDKGQYESADVLGLTYPQTMKRIVLPQMLKRVLPPIGNETITLIKDTALVYAIGLTDALRAAKIIVTRDFNITAFGVAAVFYLISTLVLTVIFSKLERRYAYYQ